MTDPARTSITTYRHEGQTICRAHVWTAKGYSSRTFNTAMEAQGWIRTKTQEATHADSR